MTKYCADAHIPTFRSLPEFCARERGHGGVHQSVNGYQWGYAHEMAIKPIENLTPSHTWACVSCGEQTGYVCPFCKGVAFPERALCGKPECREKHEGVKCLRIPLAEGQP